MALRMGLERSSPGIELDANGYVTTAALNLVAGVTLASVEDDLLQGDGNELRGKFRAAHSSSALAVNAFAPFKSLPAELQMDDRSGFATIQFERKCHHGLIGRRAPNLDLVAEGHDEVVGVESKCLEFLAPHTAKFADAYVNEIRDARRETSWFAHMQSLIENPRLYKFLDAAQLVKHAFGLSHTFPGRALSLLYIFWEPINPERDPVFSAHREEIARFASSISGSSPTFSAISYPEQWDAWDAAASTQWLREHVGQLRRRYCVAVE